MRCSASLALLPDVLSCLVTLDCVHLFPGVSDALAADACCRGDPLCQAPALKTVEKMSPGWQNPGDPEVPDEAVFFFIVISLSLFYISLSFFFLSWGLLFLIACLQHYRITICFPLLLYYFRSWILSCVYS